MNNSTHKDTNGEDYYVILTHKTGYKTVRNYSPVTLADARVIAKNELDILSKTLPDKLFGEGLSCLILQRIEMLELK